MVETLTIKNRSSINQGRCWPANTSLADWCGPAWYRPHSQKHRAGMGGGVEYCHPPTLAFTLGSLSSLGLSFDHQGPCASSVPQILSSLILPLIPLLSTKGASFFSIIQKHEGNSCLDRPHSLFFSITFALCQVQVPGHFSFNLPSYVWILQISLMSLSCFPTGI